MKSKERRPSSGDEAIDEGIKRLAALPSQERALALTKRQPRQPRPPALLNRERRHARRDVARGLGRARERAARVARRCRSSAAAR